ncbi:hypothetical protein IVB40_07465 [Bradyrhizobium sp. 40]|uniref:hypothetical protein n=1 Tax=Bradyrhizobium sp. 40 TaxID=2782674 RepID=UPI002000251C|nr:hypothetical protein [Bradyrhizobium sp. 40]UPJ43898.1 hypothetical protein IVB40_07465 [Bradyrhizobium sp. 40]
MAATLAIALWAYGWDHKRRSNGRAGVENWHLLIAGILGTWLFMSLTLGAAAWAIYTKQSLAANPSQDADVGPLRWYFNLEMEGGPPSGQPVFSLTFFGSNRSQKEVQLKSAAVVSALNGRKIELEVIARGDDGKNALTSISDINLVPPGASVKLVAKFGDPDPAHLGMIQGLDAKTFLETWSRFFLNVEDDTRSYRLPFNEGNLMAFFPGMVGPHITKR